MTIEPRPCRAIAPPITWHGTTTAEDVDVHDALERVDRHILEGADLGRRRVGRRSIAAALTSTSGTPQSTSTQRERRLDLRAVGDVALVDADRPVVEGRAQTRDARTRVSREVEDRHVHVALDERGREPGAELSHPARHDGDATGEVEQGVDHGARS